MQSGEAQVAGASRQHGGTSVIKGKGVKGKKFSLAQLLFGLKIATGSQAKPFGKVLRQLQGKLPALGKSQSRLQANGGSGKPPRGGTVRSSRAAAVTLIAGKGMSEAAKQSGPSAKGATPTRPRPVAPATSAGKTPAAPFSGTAQTAVSKGSAKPALTLGTAQTAVSKGSAKPALTLSTAQTAVAQESAKPALTLSTAQTAVAQESAKPALTLSTAQTAVAQESAKQGLSSRRAEAGAPTGSTTTASIPPENNALAKDVDPNAPASHGAARTPAPIIGAAGTGSGTALAGQVVSADPNGQPVPSGNGHAPRTGIRQPRSRRSTPASARTAPVNSGRQTAPAQRDASADAPRQLAQAQPESQPAQVSPRSVAPVPIRSTLAAVSDNPPAATPDRGTPANATQVAGRGTHALPAIDDKSVSGAGQRSGATVNPGVALAGLRQVDPNGLAADLSSASFAGADAGKSGDGKRLDVRSSRSKRPNITFVKKSDGGKTPDVSTAPAGRPAARAVSRPAAQVAPQAPDIGVKGPGANAEPVVNSLTTNDQPSSQVAGGGNGEFKIMNPVELGTQGSTETGSRTIQVPVAQTSTLTQPLNSAAPPLANLARMTVVHYNRYVSGSQNQSVFQVDGGLLGSVKITFSEASAGTTLTIMVSSPELQQQLQRALPQLQQEWSNLNLNLGQVNVQVSNSHQDNAFKGEEGKPGRPMMKQSTEDVDVPVAMAMERIMDYGYNTVEYVA